ncbi:Protein kinase [Phytophthora palmivora]|uniref:Protein kinase n=1 Tax=Phytophthora palmivora TaxID=4796 RepID=A0A2P4YBI6_9STRA|nr:Protein kinase [Phytophthora palmivora]
MLRLLDAQNDKYDSDKCSNEQGRRHRNNFPVSRRKIQNDEDQGKQVALNKLFTGRVTEEIERSARFVHPNVVTSIGASNIILALLEFLLRGDSQRYLAKISSHDKMGIAIGIACTRASFTFSSSAFWTAPKILKGKRNTEQVDIYTFGVILLEMDTGKLP